MHSDGQFDIRDLATFFPFLNAYNAVIGYRMQRQDTLLRKLNAWGWKQAVGLVLGVRVRDLDCAFKLFPTEFLHAHPLGKLATRRRGAVVVPWCRRLPVVICGRLVLNYGGVTGAASTIGAFWTPLTSSLHRRRGVSASSPRAAQTQPETNTLAAS